MVLPAPPQAAVDEIAAFGRFAADRGWVPATAGNFSRRVDARHIAITRSGVDKGNLSCADLALLSIDEPIPAGISAEAPLHLARYLTDSTAGAVLHVHTVATTVVSRLYERAGSVVTEGYEMHKALGLDTHESTLENPVFRNDQDTAKLADDVEAKLGAAGDALPAFLLAGHGIYAWGATVADARRHIEAVEFILACHLEERRQR